jgi:hypothetical protein
MPALDSSGADRIAKFTTLWESYTGQDCSEIAVLFNQAAELLELEGYDRYSRTEDQTSNGLTIFEALTWVAREHLTAAAHRSLYPHVGIQNLADDSKSLTEELETRLVGVLMVTGHHGPSSIHRDVLWSWTHDALHTGPRGTAEYRGKGHAVRLLRLAAIATMAVEAG